MTEQIGRAPQQSHAGASLMACQHVHHLLKLGDAVSWRGALRRDIPIMESIEGGAQLGEKLKSGIRFQTGRLHRIAHPLPRPLEGTVVAERIETVPGE